MKWLMLAGWIWMAAVSPALALAKTAYVNDVVKITLRSAPGIANKVLANLQSGDAMEVVEEGQEWSRVQLPDGKEGWVLTRFLTEKRPNEVLLKALQEDFEKLSKKMKTLSEENELLKKENTRLSADAAEKAGQLQAATASFENLKSESKDFLAVKSAYEKAAADLKRVSEESRLLSIRVTELEWKRNVAWFVSGAGVFLFGFLIGGVNDKGRRRKSGYY